MEAATTPGFRKEVIVGTRPLEFQPTPEMESMTTILWEIRKAQTSLIPDHIPSPMLRNVEKSNHRLKKIRKHHHEKWKT